MFLNKEEQNQQDFEVMFSNQELKIDLKDLSEIVRIGKPDLDGILSYETSKSLGKTIVACKFFFFFARENSLDWKLGFWFDLGFSFFEGCGPGGLSGIVRSLVADQVMKEGKNVEILTEDFSYWLSSPLFIPFISS